MSGTDPMAALLAAVKISLNVTWDDEQTNERYRQYIQDGVAYLDKKRGAPADYTVPGYPRSLLFDYVRYARDGALDVFENNYRAMILAMQHERMVTAYAVAEESTV